jgi:hypothetical protein
MSDYSRIPDWAATLELVGIILFLVGVVWGTVIASDFAMIAAVLGLCLMSVGLRAAERALKVGKGE